MSTLVLLVGLANAGTLLFVRAAKRRRESAIRAALGAGRGRLVWQLTLESALTLIAATAASLVLAYWMDETVRRVLLPGIIEREGADPTTLGVALVAGFVAGLIALVARAGTSSIQLAV